MPVSPDISVFGKNQGFSDYQRANEEFARKKALADAQIQLAGAQAQKALKPDEFDINKVGEQAFIKKAQGLPLTPNEDASLLYLKAKSGGMYIDEMGNPVQKPDLFEKAGFNTPPVMPNRALPVAPTPIVKQPPASNVAPKPIATNQAQDIIDVFGNDRTAQPVVLTSPTQTTPAPFATSKAAMDAEIAAAGRNPKLVQDIKTKYAGANTPDKIFQRENTYRDEFNTLTKDFRSVQDAYSKINATSNSGAGDMSLLYQYVKLLDPGSVVRESEFATAAASGGFGDRVAGAVKSIIEGGRLNESLRNEFINEADNIYKGQKEGNDRVIKKYKELAVNNGLNPDNVITNYADINPPKPKSKDLATMQFNLKKAGASDAEIDEYFKAKGLKK